MWSWGPALRVVIVGQDLQVHTTDIEILMTSIFAARTYGGLLFFNVDSVNFSLPD
jgi:hypothetical protein